MSFLSGVLAVNAKRKKRDIEIIALNTLMKGVQCYDLSLCIYRLSNLLPFKSPGPDNLHPFVLKSLCDIVCKPLAIIFQTSLDTMSLPNI